MKDSSIAVRLPSHDEFIAPVTILDGHGSVLRIVPAAEFRRHHPSSPDPGHARATARRERRSAELRLDSVLPAADGAKHQWMQLAKLVRGRAHPVLRASLRR